MKPTFSIFISPMRRDSFEHAMRQRPGWPVTDYNYHPLTFEESSRRYVCKRARSFWNITGEYFKNEARYDFWGEAALWAVLTLTAFLPLITNAHAVMEFVRAIGN
jgi:hypothetical protein